MIDLKEIEVALEQFYDEKSSFENNLSSFYENLQENPKFYSYSLSKKNKREQLCPVRDQNASWIQEEFSHSSPNSYSKALESTVTALKSILDSLFAASEDGFRIKSVRSDIIRNLTLVLKTVLVSAKLENTQNDNEIINIAQKLLKMADERINILESYKEEMPEIFYDTAKLVYQTIYVLSAELIQNSPDFNVFNSRKVSKILDKLSTTVRKGFFEEIYSEGKSILVPKPQHPDFLINKAIEYERKRSKSNDLEGLYNVILANLDLDSKYYNFLFKNEISSMGGGSISGAPRQELKESLEEGELKYDKNAYKEMSSFLISCFCDSLIKNNSVLYNIGRLYFEHTDTDPTEVFENIFEDFWDNNTYGSAWPNIESEIQIIENHPEISGKDRDGYDYAWGDQLPINGRNLSIFIKPIKSYESTLYEWQIELDDEIFFESDGPLGIHYLKSELKKFLKKLFYYVDIDSEIYNSQLLFQFLTKYKTYRDNNIYKNSSTGKSYEKKFNITYNNNKDYIYLNLYPKEEDAYKEKKAPDKTWRGIYDPRTKELVVILYSIMNEYYIDLDYLLDYILTTLRHELQHAQQMLIMKTHNLFNLGGLPDTRDPDKDFDYYNQQWKKEHPLRSVEFYPRLSDEISRFTGSTFIKDIVNDPNMSKQQIKKEVNDRIKYWTGSEPAPSNKYVPRGPTGDSVRPFFKALRDNRPTRYKKAVREFTKAIDNYLDEVLSNTEE